MIGVCALLGCTVKRLPIVECGDAAACSPDDVRTDGPTTSVCTGTERATIGRAAALVRRFADLQGIESAATARCLLDAFISPAEGAVTEIISDRIGLFVRALPDSWPLESACRDEAAAGVDSVSVSRDRLTIARSIFEPAVGADARLAAAILAAAVREGYGELRGSRGQVVDETRFSTGSQVAACVEGALLGAARPNGQPRSAMEYDLELQGVGAERGDPLELLCPAPVLGMVMLRRDRLERLDVFCDDRTAATRIGSVTSTSAVSTFNYRCPSGSVMTGVRGGYTPVMMLSVAPLCTSVTQVRARESVVGTVPGVDPPVMRVSGTFEFVRRCPPGMVLRGLRALAAQHPEEISVICRRHDEPDLPMFSTLPSIGSPGVRPTRDICSDQGALIGLQGTFTSTEVSSLGGICRGLRRQSDTWVLRSDGDVHVTPVRGEASPGSNAFGERAGGAPGLNRCGSGDALVGLAGVVSSRGALVGIEGVCASVATWTAGAASTTRRTARFGASGAVNQERLCPAGGLLVGVEVQRSEMGAGSMRAVLPLCRIFSRRAGASP